MRAIFLVLLATALGAARGSAQPTVKWTPLNGAPAPRQDAAPATPQTSDQQNAETSDYEKLYRAMFRGQMVRSCVASAAKAKAKVGGFDVTPTCACAADAFVGSRTLAELIKTKTTPVSKAELADLTAECVEKAPPVRMRHGSRDRH